MPTTLKQCSIEVLRNLLQEGNRTLALDDEARGILRRWMLISRRGGRAEAPPAPAPLSPPPAVSAPVAPQQSPAPAAEVPNTVEGKLDYLRARAEHWRPARTLGTLRSTMVFATGNPHARLMLVGEAPGYEEEQQREPFVGRAGRKLNEILRAMGLRREEVYISNICKFRPSMGEQQGTANRAPTEAEISACLPLVMAEIRAIRPACIVCLGGTAAKGLLGSGASVGSLRGREFFCQGFPVRVTYHPSYLLRNEAISERRRVWEDMLGVMRLLGMPVSAKQQNYFLPS